MRNNRWAVMWDCNGLEAVTKLPDPSDFTFAILANQNKPDMPNLMHWQLRARYNSQRHYEIWIFESDPGIERDDIVRMFENSPQHSADTIRRIGHCYYSDRAKSEVAIK